MRRRAKEQNTILQVVHRYLKDLQVGHCSHWVKGHTKAGQGFWRALYEE